MNSMANISYVTPQVNYSANYGTTLIAEEYFAAMYTRKMVIKNGVCIDQKDECFALGKIVEVTRFLYDSYFKEEEDYIFKIIPSDCFCEKYVRIPGKVYGKSGMVTELTKAGISFKGNQGDGTRASMIVNYISGMHLLKEIKVEYFNGFFDGKFRFLTDKDAGLDVDAPYFKERLCIGESRLSDAECMEEFLNYIQIFTGQVWIKLTSLIALSLMQSLLAEKGFKFTRLLWLCGEGTKAAMRFIQIYNQGQDVCISLENNLPTLKQKLFQHKDSIVFFIITMDRLIGRLATLHLFKTYYGK